MTSELAVMELIGRMKAPDEPTGAADQRRLPWWLRELSLAGIVGLFIGVLLFVFVPASGAGSAPPVAASSTAKAEIPAGGVFAKEILPQEPMVAPPLIAAVETSVQREPIKKAASFWWAGATQRQYRELLARGWRHLEKARYSEAAVAFGRALHLKPTGQEGYFGLALSLFEQGHEAEALSVMERVTGKKGGRAELWLLLGTAYQFMGQEQQARDAYRKYLRLSPAGPYARDVRSLLARNNLPRLVIE